HDPAQPAPAQGQPPSGAKLSNGTVVQLLGVTTMPAGQWWGPDGAAIAPPCDDPTTKGGISAPTHAIALSIVDPPGSDFAHSISFDNVGGWGSYHAKRGGAEMPGVAIYTLEPSNSSTTISVKVAVASGAWSKIASASGHGVMATSGPGHDVCISELSL